MKNEPITHRLNIGEPAFFQGIRVVYAGMPSDSTFSLVISDVPLYFRKDKGTIEHKEPRFSLRIMNLDADFMEFQYLRS
jgi:hypothetical protein